MNQAQQATLKAAIQRPPREVGIDLADWNWKVVRRFVSERFGVTLQRSSCRTYLHRLGFVVKRPIKHLLKADEAKREAFVASYAASRVEAQTSGAKHVFVDEAHFYADVDLRGKWVLKGTPALVDSTSPRYGEKASYYSAVCLETGEVEAMPLEGNSNADTSVAFLKQLRAHHSAPLVVFWDNAPAHGGEPLRAYLRTPELRLRLVRLPAYSPDFNAAEPRPTYDRGSTQQPQEPRQYHGGTPQPSLGRGHPAGGPALPPQRSAPVGDRVAGWRPAVCPGLLVHAGGRVGREQEHGGHPQGPQGGVTATRARRPRLEPERAA